MTESGWPRIKFVAGPDCPDYLRRYDGEFTHPIPPDTPIPVAGTPGWMWGRPGVMRWTPDGPAWEMTAEPEPVVDHGPPWARALAAQLDEIKAMLAERSDAPPNEDLIIEESP